MERKYSPSGPKRRFFGKLERKKSPPKVERKKSPRTWREKKNASEPNFLTPWKSNGATLNEV